MAQAGSARERSWITEADRRELDDEVMTSLIVVDSREAVLRESGDVILSKAKIYAEVGRPSRGRSPARRHGRRCSSPSVLPSRISLLRS